VAHIGFDEHHMENSVANPDSDGFSILAERLEAAGHRVDRIETELPTQEPLPWDVLVIPFPKKPFSAEESLALHEHLRSGKGLLLLAEWGDLFDHVDHLNELTSPYGIQIQRDRVTDLTEHLTQEVRLGGVVLDEQATLHFVKIRTFTDHPVTEGLEEIIYFSGCSLRAVEPAVVLASTEESSFGDLDLDQRLGEGESQGSLPVAVASEAAGRLVVVGDCNIAANGYIEEGDNMRFVMQTMEWLLFER
jgi:hypothetical protein